jgi:hypothetical protein
MGCSRTSDCSLPADKFPRSRNCPSRAPQSDGSLSIDAGGLDDRPPHCNLRRASITPIWPKRPITGTATSSIEACGVQLGAATASLALASSRLCFHGLAKMPRRVDPVLRKRSCGTVETLKTKITKRVGADASMTIESPRLARKCIMPALRRLVDDALFAVFCLRIENLATGRAPDRSCPQCANALINLTARSHHFPAFLIRNFRNTLPSSHDGIFLNSHCGYWEKST